MLGGACSRKRCKRVIMFFVSDERRDCFDAIDLDNEITDIVGGLTGDCLFMDIENKQVVLLSFSSFGDRGNTIGIVA